MRPPPQQSIGQSRRPHSVTSEAGHKRNCTPAVPGIPQKRVRSLFRRSATVVREVRLSSAAHAGEKRHLVLSVINFCANFSSSENARADNRARSAIDRVPTNRSEERGPMSRPPTYRPKFSRKEIGKARRIARRRKSSHGQARRARLAVLLHEERELSNSELAERLGVHRNTVGNWCKRWAEEGFQLGEKPRSGRPRDFSPSTDHDDQKHRV